jgi:serine/threonine protein kinase
MDHSSFAFNQDCEEKQSHTMCMPFNIGNTKHTVYVGTKLYMAPEQQTSSKTYNHKVNLHALAIILFEMLMDPFETESERAKSISKLKLFQLPTEFEEFHGTDMVKRRMCI